MSIDVFEGPMLSVSADASSLTVAPGTTVAFTTKVSGNDGSPLTYDWNFGSAGPAPSSAASPQETFTVPGTYAISLEVTDSSGGGGGNTLTLTVTGGGTPNGKAPTGPTKSPSKQPGSGSPTRRAGGHNPQTRTQTSQTSTQTQTTATTTTTAPTTTSAESATATTPSTTTSSPQAPPDRARRPIGPRRAPRRHPRVRSSAAAWCRTS